MNHNALAIESRPGNFTVLSRFLEKMNIKALHVQKLDEVYTVLNSVKSVSVAIIDLVGFDDNVWDYCKELRKRDIPMLIISSGSSSGNLETHRQGAAVFQKPVLMHELAACIRSLINQE